MPHDDLIYKVNDICDVVSKFQKKNGPTERYASFDYCYSYFRHTSSQALMSDMEKSCLAIGFYLASWGMLRGSSFLLDKSVKYYEPLIQYIAKQDKNVWNVDVDKYDKENIEKICGIYKDIKKIIIENGNSDLTLVTKILLGVFGFVPAYDDNFCHSFRKIFGNKCGFRSLNANSLNCIKSFYEYNREDIDSLSNKLFLIEFATGGKTKVNYTKAKIIDMYGFTKGLTRSR